MQADNAHCQPRICGYHLYVVGSNLMQGVMYDPDIPDMPRYYPSGLDSSYFLDATSIEQIKRNKEFTVIFLDHIVSISKFKSYREMENIELLRFQWLRLFGDAMLLLQQPALVDQYRHETERLFIVEQEEQNKQNATSFMEAGDIAMCRAVLGSIFSEALEASKFPNHDNEVLVIVIHHNTENDVVYCEIITPHTWLPCIEHTKLQGHIKRQDLIVVIDQKRRKQTRDFVSCLYGSRMGVGHIVQVWRHPRAPWLNGLHVEIIQYVPNRAAWLARIVSNLGTDNQGLDIMLDPHFTDAQLQQQQGMCVAIEQLRGQNEQLHTHRKVLLDNNQYLLHMLRKKGICHDHQHEQPQQQEQVQTTTASAEAIAVEDTMTIEHEATADETPRKPENMDVAQLASQLHSLSADTVLPSPREQAAANERERLQAEAARPTAEKQAAANERLQAEAARHTAEKQAAANERERLQAELAKLSQHNEECKTLLAKSELVLVQERTMWRRSLHAQTLSTEKKTRMAVCSAVNQLLHPLGCVVLDTEDGIQLEQKHVHNPSSGV